MKKKVEKKSPWEKKSSSRAYRWIKKYSEPPSYGYKKSLNKRYYDYDHIENPTNPSPEKSIGPRWTLGMRAIVRLHLKNTIKKGHKNP